MKTYLQRPDRTKNYFPVPNQIYQLGLSAMELSIYGYLISLEDKKTYQCYPSYRAIGNAVSISTNTVRKYVARLVEKGLITTERTTVRVGDGTVRNGTLLYTIRPIREAVELHHERQLRELEETTARSKVKSLAEKCGLQFSPAESEARP